MEKKRIYLSPSTQENNVGVDDYGTEEYRMNLIADNLEKLLEDSGKYIVYRNNEKMDISEIVAESNKLNPDIHVAIHSNAGNTVATGPEVFIAKEDGKSEILADALYDNIMKIYYDQSKGRGVKIDNELRELRETNAPSSLIEIAFHDNIKDADWIVSNTDEIALALKKGIDEYFTKIGKSVENIQ